MGILGTEIDVDPVTGAQVPQVAACPVKAQPQIAGRRLCNQV